MSQYQIKAGLAEVESFKVCGVSMITSNARAAEDINQLWESFFTQNIGQSVTSKIDDVIYAVYSDYEGDYTKPFRITIGYRTQGQETPQGLRHVVVKAAPYAVLSAAGEQPKALIETWKAIWASDLVRSFETDFEVYGPRFFQDGVHEVLVHVGVKHETD